MRNENSEFNTNFVTGAGDYKENRDYFAYIEFDEYACWVMADGLDSDDDMLSSKIVVESIINDFSENPTMKKRSIKAFIRRANQILLNQSRRVNLKATVLVVVTDYKSIIWANVGNTRLYHFRKDRIKNRSKDQSLAQMMLEVGYLEDDNLNYHEERNNLSQYLGQQARIKPNFSKKNYLKDDDILLLVTSGFWEQIIDENLRRILKSIDDDEEFITELEENILEEAEELDNYTIATILAEKTYQEKVKQGLLSNLFTKKKLAVVLIPLIVIASSYFTYRQIVKMRSNREQTIAQENERLDRLKESINLEGQGDDLAHIGNYDEAVEKYQAAVELYTELGNESRKEDTAEKIDNIEKIIDGLNLEARGDNEFENGNYQAAISKYEQAELVLANRKVGAVADIKDKITKSRDIIEADNLQEQGDIFYSAENFLIAKEKYQMALRIYGKYDMNRKTLNIKKNLEQINNILDRTKAEQLKNDADKLIVEGEFETAVDKYNEAKDIFENIGEKQETITIRHKLQNLTIEKDYRRAKEYERRGDEFLSEEDYEASLKEYKQANQIYSRLDKREDLIRIENKVDQVEEENGSSFFLFF